MGLKTWFRENFMEEPVEISISDWEKKFTETAIRELCFWACVKMVSSAISQCEFKTFLKHEEVEQDEYYRWNLSPNANQTSIELMNKMVYKLFEENEVLIVERSGQFFVADSFSKTSHGAAEDDFAQIKVGDTDIPKRKARDVIYFTLADNNVNKVVGQIYSSYKELFAAGTSYYKRVSGMKGILTIESTPSGTAEQREEMDKKLHESMKMFFEKPNSVFRVGRGQTFDVVDKNGSVTPSSRDVRNLINDIADYTATAFNIPSTLLTGEVENTANAVDQFLTFCIDPLAKLIAAAINKTIYTKEQFLSGCYIKIDTKAVKHVDLLSVATAVDKLIGSGAFCINDIRKVCGEETIDADWAKQHYITKNYSQIEEILKAVGGGG
ncbi:MAG: phage portal protein [Clostridiales Family XIII bacterium]|jgi:HK97 family phage portal protein|nr:phage portal protein [Clostridiales Family XIII bacterium]